MDDTNNDNTKYTIADLRSPKAIALVRDNPGNYRILASGAVYDNTAGKIVTVDSSLNPYAITRQNARDIAKKRHEKAALAASKGIMESVNEHGIPARGTLAAWAYIVKHQTDIALDAKGRTSTDAAYFVGRAAGYLGAQDKDKSDDSQSSDSSVTFSGQAANMLLDAIQRAVQRRQGDGFDNDELSKP